MGTVYNLLRRFELFSNTIEVNFHTFGRIYRLDLVFKLAVDIHSSITCKFCFVPQRTDVPITKYSNDSNESFSTFPPSGICIRLATDIPIINTIIWGKDSILP